MKINIRRNSLYVFFEVFELNEVPNQNNALEIFDQIEATLKKEEFKLRTKQKII